MISHIRRDSGPVVGRVVQWSYHLTHGKTDRRQSLTKAEFVRGGTIGPVNVDGP